jgi:hypothetical protein
MAHALWNALADRDVLPGRIMNASNHFRISLTASGAMVARARLTPVPESALKP